MASANQAEAPNPVDNDDLDQLFDLDTTLEDIFGTRNNVDTSTKRGPSNEKSRDAEALGIDEEIKITKKRQPIAKLDATRYVTHD
jgi:replication fork protection complex subunit Csm3/Swi3